MRLDKDIRNDVGQELDCDSELGTRDIAVAVRGGVVTLAGFVSSFGERALAEADARRVDGVAGIANDIEVRLPLIGRKPDPQIVREVVAGLQSEVPTARQHIRVRVADGRVGLEGEVPSQNERLRAEEVVRRIRGVRSIGNDILVKPPVPPVEIKHRIEFAFQLSAEIDADTINVETADDATVILTGSVRSSAQQQEAGRVARLAPGVRKVENRIRVLL